MAENINIPVDVGKFLFTEDLINFIMSKSRKVQVQFQQFEIEHIGFNKTIQNAVSIMERTRKFQADIFELQNVNALNRDTFINFEKNLKQKYFPNGLNHNTLHNFLEYCARLAILASYFYVHRVLDAPDIASLSINSLWINYDMTTGGWDTLNRIAEEYVSLSIGQHAMNLDLPNRLASDEEMSENSAIHQNAYNMTNESGTSDDMTGVMDDDIVTNKENIEKSQKRLLEEKEQTNASKKFCKYNTEIGDNSSDSQMS